MSGKRTAPKGRRWVTPKPPMATGQRLVPGSHPGECSVSAERVSWPWRGRIRLNVRVRCATRACPQVGAYPCGVDSATATSVPLGSTRADTKKPRSWPGLSGLSKMRKGSFDRLSAWWGTPLWVVKPL